MSAQDQIHTLPINNFLTCESHPGRLWNGAHTEEDGPLCPVEGLCPGPGMPLLASLAYLEEELTPASLRDDTLFVALLTLHMCDDPTNLTPEQDAAVEAALEGESRRRGYDGWVVAFHEFKP